MAFVTARLLIFAVVTFRSTMFSVCTALSASFAFVTASAASFAVVTFRSAMSAVWTSPSLILSVVTASGASLAFVTERSVMSAVSTNPLERAPVPTADFTTPPAVSDVATRGPSRYTAPVAPMMTSLKSPSTFRKALGVPMESVCDSALISISPFLIDV